MAQKDFRISLFTTSLDTFNNLTFLKLVKVLFDINHWYQKQKQIMWNDFELVFGG